MAQLPTFSRELPLVENLKLAQDAVRAQPTNSKARVYLFQLQAVLGHWDKALSQLQSAAQFDAQAIPMAQMYREAILCEVFREEVFAGKRTPNMLGAPLQWTGHLVEALSLYAKGKYEEAATLREECFDSAVAVSGTIDEKRFEWIADADSRFGPVAEVYVKGQYYWLPFEFVKSLRVHVPEDLRDLVWCPVSITLKNEGEHIGLMPVRYPGLSTDVGDAYRLGRVTDWIEHPGETWFGKGQRMFATDAGEHSLLDVRSIQFA